MQFLRATFLFLRSHCDHRFWSVCACGLTLSLAIGCGGGEDGADTAPSDDADSSQSDSATPVDNAPADEVYKYTLDQISPQGDHGPPLDGGRVELAPPKNWNVGSRQSGMLVWYHEFKDAKLLPQIRVKAEDAPEGAPQNATVDDAKSYAAWVDKWVKEQIGDETLVEPVVPLVLGENAFGRYVRAGKYKGNTAHRQILVTTLEGRVYIIELIVFEGQLEKTRKHVLDGYAVGASLRKASDDGIGGFQPPGEGQ